MIFIICLIGKTASGKDSVLNRLVDKHGYKKIITHTTRPMRKGEKQDVTYHFTSLKEFQKMIKQGLFAEYKTYDTEFDTWYYGTTLKNLENADDRSIIIITPEGYKDIKNKVKCNIKSIYLYADNETIKKRLILRGDNPEEAERRLNHDNEDFKNVENENEVDKIIYNNFDTDIEQVVEEILEFAR